jgi:hypothetical protein
MKLCPEFLRSAVEKFMCQRKKERKEDNNNNNNNNKKRSKNNKSPNVVWET